jgi:hypothetical protein
MVSNDFSVCKSSLEFTCIFGKSDNLPVILQRTDSRKDAKIAKKRMDVNDEDWNSPNCQKSPMAGRVLAIFASLREEFGLEFVSNQKSVNDQTVTP